MNASRVQISDAATSVKQARKLYYVKLAGIAYNIEFVPSLCHNPLQYAFAVSTRLPNSGLGYQSNIVWSMQIGNDCNHFVQHEHRLLDINTFHRRQSRPLPLISERTSNIW